MKQNPTGRKPPPPPSSPPSPPITHAHAHVDVDVHVRPVVDHHRTEFDSESESDLDPDSEMPLTPPRPPPRPQDRDEPPTPVLPSFTTYLRTTDSRRGRSRDGNYDDARGHAHDTDAGAGPSTREKINKFLRGEFGQIGPDKNDKEQEHENGHRQESQHTQPQIGSRPQANAQQKGSQTDWYLTDAPKLEHGLRRTFNPSATYRELDRRRGAAPEDSEEGRVRMADIKDAVDPRKLLFILRFIVTSGVLLIISGGVFFIHLVSVTITKGSAEYLSFYMENNLGTMLIMWLGIFHPVVIGLYCLYAGKHLRSVRPFYWRASVTLLIPITILGLCIKTIVFINRNLEIDFHEWMVQYPDSTQSHKMWDLAQNSLRCCGMQGYMDWTRLNKTIPDSCCVDIQNCELAPAWRKTGCIALLRDDLNLFTTVYVVIVVLQLIFQVMAIVGMRKFYIMIRNFFTIEPTVFQILTGPCSIVSDACSACFPRRKTRFEFDETHDLEHDLLPRDKHGDLKFKAPFPWTT